MLRLLLSKLKHREQNQKQWRSPTSAVTNTVPLTELAESTQVTFAANIES